MEVDKVKAALDAADLIIGWFAKAHKYFEPFRPEIKTMTINYKEKRSEIDMMLHIPLGFRRRQAIEIPAYDGFSIFDMRDESFGKVIELWRFENGMWKLDASKLPTSERYIVMLRGKVANGALQRLVRIQPAKNRDQTDELDRFWLDCMLRDAELLVDIWKELNINDVPVNIKVALQRCFATVIPSELRHRFSAMQRMMIAARGRDPEELMRAWSQMRRVKQRTSVPVEDLISSIVRFTNGEAFANFLTVDQPFQLGEIRPEQFDGPLPGRMGVEATTELSLKKQNATGYLSFKKKNYMAEIEQSLDKMKA